MKRTLTKLCEPIWGEHWQTPFAAYMGVDTRTVRRWCKKESEPYAWVLEKLEELRKKGKPE